MAPGGQGVFLVLYDFVERDGEDGAQGDHHVDEDGQGDGGVDGPGNVALRCVHFVDGVDDELEAFVSHEGDGGDDQQGHGVDRSFVGQQGWQGGLAVVDQHERDDGEDDQLGVHHEVFQFAHAPHREHVDDREHEDDAAGHQFAGPHAVGKGKAADGVRGEGVGVQGQGADVAEDDPPADEGGGKRRAGEGAFEEGVGGTLVLVVHPELDVGVGGEGGDEPADHDHQGRVGPHQGDGDPQYGKDAAAHHAAQGDGDEFGNAQRLAPGAVGGAVVVVVEHHDGA